MSRRISRGGAELTVEVTGRAALLTASTEKCQGRKSRSPWGKLTSPQANQAPHSPFIVLDTFARADISTSQTQAAHHVQPPPGAGTAAPTRPRLGRWGMAVWGGPRPKHSKTKGAWGDGVPASVVCLLFASWICTVQYHSQYPQELPGARGVQGSTQLPGRRSAVRSFLNS
jgi:hypothetical protein